MKTTRDKTASELMSHLTPLAPPADARQRMKNQLLSRIHDDGFTTIRAEEGDWQPIATGVSKKILRTDLTGASFLLRFLPDAILPAHEHTVFEECLVLEGDVGIGDLCLNTGDYQVVTPGTRHRDALSRNGCLLYIRTQR